VSQKVIKTSDLEHDSGMLPQLKSQKKYLVKKEKSPYRLRNHYDINYERKLANERKIKAQKIAVMKKK